MSWSQGAPQPTSGAQPNANPWSWMTQGAQQPAGQGMYSPQMVQGARGDLLAQLGMGLMAAGQPMSGAQRAQYLSQLGGVGQNYQQDLAQRLQQQQAAQQYQQQQQQQKAWADVISNATPEQLAKLGIAPETQKLYRALPQTSQQDIYEKGVTSQLGKQGSKALFGTPVWGTDANGNWVLMQMGNTPGDPLQQSAAPPGVKLATPQEVYQQRATGTVQGKTQTQAQDVQNSLSSAQDTVQGLLADTEGGGWYSGIFGAQTTTSPLITQKGYNYAQRVETLKSQVFPIVIQQMIGLGALSDAEGRALSNQIGSLAPGQGDQTAQTLTRITQFLNNKWQAFQSQAGVPAGERTQLPNQQQSPQIRTYNPQTGNLE